MRFQICTEVLTASHVSDSRIGLHVQRARGGTHAAGRGTGAGTGGGRLAYLGLLPPPVHDAPRSSPLRILALVGLACRAQAGETEVKAHSGWRTRGCSVARRSIFAAGSESAGKAHRQGDDAIDEAAAECYD